MQGVSGSSPLARTRGCTPSNSRSSPRWWSRLFLPAFLLRSNYGIERYLTRSHSPIKIPERPSAEGFSCLAGPPAATFFARANSLFQVAAPFSLRLDASRPGPGFFFCPNANRVSGSFLFYGRVRTGPGRSDTSGPCSGLSPIFHIRDSRNRWWCPGWSRNRSGTPRCR